MKAATFSQVSCCSCSVAMLEGQGALLIVLGLMSLATNKAHPMLVVVWANLTLAHANAPVMAGYISMFLIIPKYCRLILSHALRRSASAVWSQREHLGKEWKIELVLIIKVERLLQVLVTNMDIK